MFVDFLCRPKKNLPGFFSSHDRPQTDVLTPMTSVTKDGIVNTFRDIQTITR